MAALTLQSNTSVSSGDQQTYLTPQVQSSYGEYSSPTSVLSLICLFSWEPTVFPFKSYGCKVQWKQTQGGHWVPFFQWNQEFFGSTGQHPLQSWISVSHSFRAVAQLFGCTVTSLDLRVQACFLPLAMFPNHFMIFDLQGDVVVFSFSLKCLFLWIFLWFIYRCPPSCDHRQGFGESDWIVVCYTHQWIISSMSL